MDEVNTNLDSETFKLQKANDIIVQLTAQKHAREIYDLKVKSRDQVSKNLDLKFIESEQIQASLEEIEVSLAAANRSYDIVRKASVDSVGDIIGAINANAAYYIGKMFPEGETSVIIRNSKQLKNGDEKPELSVVITHKGAKVKKLKSLSGGEKARLTLAFQLALSNLYKSPLLLVDEACSGLDADSMEKCFHLLKEASSDKLVILVEHGALEHMFDQIVEVS
jgi:chromosome segregation protein